MQKDEYELWVATQTLNIFCHPLPNNSRWICPRTYCNRCRNIIINHSPAPLRWIVVLSLIPWSSFDWMKKKKQNSQKVFQKDKPTIFFLNIALINRTPDKLPNRKVIWNLELKNITNERIRHMRFGLLIYF